MTQFIVHGKSNRLGIRSSEDKFLSKVTTHNLQKRHSTCQMYRSTLTHSLHKR